MFDAIARLKSELKTLAADFDPDVVEARSAAVLVEDFAEMERLCAALKGQAAKRMANSGVWRNSAERSPAHWLAKRTGTSVGDAVKVIETAERLGDLPAVEQAVRSGALSEVQAKEIASAAAASPQAEAELLAVAQTQGMGTLKQACSRVKAAASEDETDRYERIRVRRYLRSWTDSEGAFRLDAKMTPDAGAEFMAALAPFKEKIFNEARARGRKESYDAYAADALVAMARASVGGGSSSSSKPKAMVNVVVSADALRRGHTEAGETCEIPGIGPIPVATAQSLAMDSLLCVLLKEENDIRFASSMTRTISARLRRALEERDRTCSVRGCDVSEHLEIDHIVGFVGHKVTSLEECDRKCRWHHYLKTHRGYRHIGPAGDCELAPPEVLDSG